MMGFEPSSGGDHSILEAVFGLSTARPFSPAELELVIKNHSMWKQFLPRFVRQPGIAFTVGPDGSLMQIEQHVGGAVLFERIKPDGSPEWRLRIEGNTIFVNCLAYTRWKEVWGDQVQPLLEQVTSLLTAADNKVASIVLQYIDSWDWNGPQDEYDLAGLLEKGDRVPPSVFKNGPFWHLHQGRFLNGEEGLPPSQILERINLDAVVDPNRDLAVVKFDTYLSYELPEPIELPGIVSANSMVSGWFDVLHKMNNRVMGSTMTADARQRIKLNA